MAFYLYLLPMPGWLALGLVLFFALLTFVPTRYLYPTQGGRLGWLTSALGAAWAVLLLVLLIRLPPERQPGRRPDPLALASLAFPVYYLAASWLVSLRAPRSGPAPPPA